jgi:2-iminobutanoate/2-iminopropanoate deaminase
MTRRVISTPKAPTAIGPYSQAIEHGGVVYCSGQIAIDPATGKLVDGSAAEQARLALENLQAVLQAAGSDLAHALRLTVFLTDMDDFAAVNDVYRTFFGEAPPARACVEVSRLPKGVRVEIDALAALA